MSTIDKAFLFLHALALVWYIAGLVAVQISLLRGIQTTDQDVRGDSFEEASHYQGILMVPGGIALAATALFFWSQLDYNLFGTGWLIALEVVYILTMLVCLPFVGMGLRRARIAALAARRAGRVTPELEQVMKDNVPLFFAGIATLLVPLGIALSVFRPF